MISGGAAFPNCLAEPELITFLFVTLSNLFLSPCISHISILHLVLYSLLLLIRPLIPFAVSWLTENIFLTKKDSNTFLFISLLTSMCSFCFGASLCFGVFLTFPTSNLLNSGPYSLPFTSCILQP